MKNIKFRAWSKEWNKMFKVDSIVFSDTLDFSTPHIMDSSNDCHEMENVELMQYTGLKDKNSKDIYEGDIVKYTIDDEDIIGDVLFYAGSFTIVDNHYNRVSLFDFRIRNTGAVSVEILGNIYENPELL